MKLPALGEFRVLTLRECPPELGHAVCDTPDKAADYWRVHIARDQRFNPEVESLFGLVLSTRRHILGHYVVATGTLDTILCHPREVYRPALVAAASAIILMHNHPSGDPTPSPGDIKCTRDCIKAGQILHVELLDHVIMGKAGVNGRTTDYVSLRELGYFAGV